MPAGSLIKRRTWVRIEKEAIIDTPFKTRLLLPRMVNVKVGQYINLWLPAVSFWRGHKLTPPRLFQSQKKQSVLGLLIQPRRGLIGTISPQLRTIGSNGYSPMARYDEPRVPASLLLAIKTPYLS